MVRSVLADEQELTYNSSARTKDVVLEDLQRAMGNRDRWKERESLGYLCQ